MTRPGGPPPPAPGPGGRAAPPLASAVLAGALLVPLLAIIGAAVLAGWSVDAPLARFLLSRAVSPYGWFGLPLLGAGLGMLAVARGMGSGPRTARTVAFGLGLVAMAFLVLARVPPGPVAGRPGARNARAKAQEILRAAFRSPAALEGILHYTRDPDPIVREQAALALGVNLVVAGVEHATPERPSLLERLPLRDSLRVRLLAALGDSAEAVRAEAARALWKAPRAFGVHPEAAETLASILDRSLRPQAVERLAWLALDAAGGAADPRLRDAAARFAAATPDSELARAARRALGR